MKIRVGVLFGGESTEHEVSIISALQAVNHFNYEKYEVIPIYITKKNRFYVGEKIGDIKAYTDIQKLLKESQQVILMNTGKEVELMKYPVPKFGKLSMGAIDIAFPIVHGTNVEDGTLQGYLRMLNLPYVGADVTASALGMDKQAMKAVLKMNDIPVLSSLEFHDSEDREEVYKQIQDIFSYPVIVKPVNLGSSVGIKVARDSVELQEAVENAFQYAQRILVERAITKLKEVNCSVYGDFETATASECEEPVNHDEILSYEDKYLSGGKNKGTAGTMENYTRKLPADISKEVKEKIQRLAVDTFRVLNCNGVVRIDFMIDMENEELYVNEINTIPGSLAFYLWEATGLKYKDLLDKLVQLALKRERLMQNVSFSFDTNILANAQLSGSKSGSKW